MTLHEYPDSTQLQLQLHALRGDAPACLTELGFEPISPEQFPPHYRFGAKIGALIKHTNLVLHKS
jgi:hypothetical protein